MIWVKSLATALAEAINHLRIKPTLVRELLLKFRNATILVVAPLSHRRQVVAVLMDKIEKIGVVVDGPIEFQDVAAIQIQLAGADARPHGLIAPHVGVDRFRHHFCEATRVVERIGGVLEQGYVLQVHRLTDNRLSLGDQRELLNVAQLCC